MTVISTMNQFMDLVLGNLILNVLELHQNYVQLPANSIVTVTREQ